MTRRSCTASAWCRTVCWNLTGSHRGVPSLAPTNTRFLFNSVWVISKSYTVHVYSDTCTCIIIIYFDALCVDFLSCVIVVVAALFTAGVRA